MKTKAFHRFEMRLAHFDADLELADGISSLQNRGKLYTTGSQYLFDFIDPAKHTKLANRKSSSHNRRIAVNHLKNTMYSSYIKDLYEDISEYFKQLLQAAARNGFDPNRLIGEHKVSLDANTILSAGSLNTLIDHVAEEVFRKLENERSTPKLISKMNSKLDLGIQQSIIDDALPYLEVRHLLVHADGVADNDFCNKYSSIWSQPGRKINLTFTLTSNARQAVLALAKEFDSKVLGKNMLSNSDIK